MGDQYTEVVRDWSKTLKTKVVERFLGFANYQGNFILHFSEVAALLYALTDKATFLRDREHEQAFQDLILRLISPPVLAIPTQDGHFILDTDAKDFVFGGELC